MDVRQFPFHPYKFLAVILAFLSIGPGMSLAASRDLALQEQEFPEAVVKARVPFLINRIIENSSVKLKDGSSATTMPVVPSNADLQEVKRFGDQAVKVLATYVNSTRAIEQHVSLRFLLEFHNDSALTALQLFAEKSTFAGIRQEAIAALIGFPRESVKQIVERISNSDPNPDVRAYARHVLLSFPHDQSSATQ